MAAIAGIAFAAAVVLAVALQYPKAAALAPPGEEVRGDLGGPSWQISPEPQRMSPLWGRCAHGDSCL